MKRIASSASTRLALAVLSLLPALAAAQTPPIKVGGVELPPIPTPDPACELKLQLQALGVTNLQAPGSFSYTCAGPYHPRYVPAPDMVTLDDGTVLLAGGRDLIPGTDELLEQRQSEAELYQPSTGIWTSTGALSVIRVGHTVTRLNSGEVLVVGGTSAGIEADPAQSGELYNPKQHGFRASPPPLLPHSAGHTATLLKNGKVLVAGGSGWYSPATAAAELYDPVAGTWTLAGSMNAARAWHTATLLADGRVLVAGGASTSDTNEQTVTSFASAEIYDPASNSFTPTGSLNSARSTAAAGLLSDGRVLIQGGVDCSPGVCTAPGVVEVYDPAAGVFLPYGPVDNIDGDYTFAPAVIALPNGKALLIGTGQPQLFDPATNSLSPAAARQTAACPFGPATLLHNGQVLSQGAIDQCNSLARTTLLYQPLP